MPDQNRRRDDSISFGEMMAVGRAGLDVLRRSTARAADRHESRRAHKSGHAASRVGPPTSVAGCPVCLSIPTSPTSGVRC